MTFLDVSEVAHDGDDVDVDVDDSNDVHIFTSTTTRRQRPIAGDHRSISGPTVQTKNLYIYLFSLPIFGPVVT